MENNNGKQVKEQWSRFYLCSPCSYIFSLVEHLLCSACWLESSFLYSLFLHEKLPYFFLWWCVFPSVIIEGLKTACAARETVRKLSTKVVESTIIRRSSQKLCVVNVLFIIIKKWIRIFGFTRVTSGRSSHLLSRNYETTRINPLSLARRFLLDAVDV